MKNKNQVWGYVHNCKDYDPCPLCYGCRNYGIWYNCYYRCGGKNVKFNTCNTKLHTPANLAKMVSSPTPITIEKV